MIAPIQGLFPRSPVQAAALLGLTVDVKRDFGASGSANTFSGTVVSGSNLLTGLASNQDFQSGQGILVAHAGPGPYESGTTPLPPPGAPTVTPEGTAGVTTYGYVVVAITPGGGATAASATGETTTGNATLSITNYNSIAWSSVSGAGGYLIYGVSTNPSGSVGLLAAVWGGTLSFDDYGFGPIVVAPWFPTAPPTEALGDNLITTVAWASGEQIQLSQTATADVTGTLVMHDDSVAVANAVASLPTGGGVIDFPAGTYHVTLSNISGNTSGFVATLNSNVTLRSNAEAVILRYNNPAIELNYTFVTPSGGASGWTVEGLVFDGGNTANSAEWVDWPVYAQGTCDGWMIRGCEFRYVRGKAIMAETGTQTRYRITECYIHHCQSNAIGFSGTGFFIDHNTIENCILEEPGGVGAESLIGTQGSVDGTIDHNTIISWGPISLGSSASHIRLTVSENTVIAPSGQSGGAFGTSVDTTDLRLIGNDFNSSLTTNGSTSIAINQSGGSSDGVIISGNRVIGNQTGGSPTIELQNVTNATIANNLVTGVNGAMSFPDIYLVDTTNVAITGNVHQDATSGISIQYSGTTAEIAVVGEVAPAQTVFLPPNSLATGNLLGSIAIPGDYCSVVGNTFETAGNSISSSSGVIWITGGSYCVVAANVINLNAETSDTPAISEYNGSTASTANYNVIRGNSIQNNTGTSPVARADIIRVAGAQTIVEGNAGYQPWGWSTTTPALPAGAGSADAVANATGYRVRVYQVGASGTHIVDPDGTDTALPSDPTEVTLDPAAKLYYATTVPSSWKWYGT